LTSVLLDTHVLLWIAADRSPMSRTTVDLLLQQQLYVSVISIAEIAIKASLGKLPLPTPFATDFGGAVRGMLAQAGVELLHVDLEAIEHLRQLPFHHRDPFDRIIIAQAFANGLKVATRDKAFRAYDGLLILEV
jgi:PIN domain nuclease of toxin-antitoxin system